MTSPKVALIMGVCNKRSIAWSCTQAFLDKGWDVILTYQNKTIQSKVEKYETTGNEGQILGGFTCDVGTDDVLDMPQRLADILKERKVSSVLHSIAHAPDLKTTPLIGTSKESYLKAHEISAYSLISIARVTQPLLETRNGTSNVTALSYLGATRAVPGYNIMGSAKASLEAIVRGLALEMASTSDKKIRVNAVSAGPIATISSKGGISNFSKMQQEMYDRAPLGNITPEQVASTVYFLATGGSSGITGQTLYVDGGYSIVAGPPTV